MPAETLVSCPTPNQHKRERPNTLLATSQRLHFSRSHAVRRVHAACPSQVCSTAPRTLEQETFQPCFSQGFRNDFGIPKCQTATCARETTPVTDYVKNTPDFAVWRKLASNNPDTPQACSEKCNVRWARSPWRAGQDVMISCKTCPGQSPKELSGCGCVQPMFGRHVSRVT